MKRDTALRLLGLERHASWDEARAAHRRLIRAAHPDAGGDAAAAAALNRALDVIATSPDREQPPLPADGFAARPPSTVVGTVDESPVHLLATDDPTEVLLRLAEAAHEVGEVVFVDAHAGLLEVIVGEGAAAAQLAVAVDDSLGLRVSDGVPVAFTLEPLGRMAPPPIHEVVTELMAAARRQPPPGREA